MLAHEVGESWKWVPDELLFPIKPSPLRVSRRDEPSNKFDIDWPMHY